MSRAAVKAKPAGIHASAFIHPKAHVEDAIIGARSKVWQFASVIRGARLGEDCNVASGACFDGSRADDRVIICHNLAAGPGFWLQDDVFIGPNVTLCNDNWPRAHKRGFEGAVEWSIIVEKGATIGANAVVMPGVRIGAGAMVAAGSVVSRNVPPKHLHRMNGQVEPITDEEAKCASRVRLVGALVR